MSQTFRRLVHSLLLTLIGLSTQAQSNDYALQLSDSGQYITLPSTGPFDYAGASVFTIEATCFYKGGKTNSSIFGKSFSGLGTLQIGFFIDAASGKLVYAQDRFGSTGWQTILTSKNPFPLNRWVHVALVKSGLTVKLFIDGAVDTTGTVNNFGSMSKNSTGPTYIGKSPMGEGFAGSIDEFRIWNTPIRDYVLKSWRRGRMMDHLHPMAASLVACYHMDEGSGQVLMDCSPSIRGGGASHTAIAMGNPVWVKHEEPSTFIVDDKF